MIINPIIKGGGDVPSGEPVIMVPLSFIIVSSDSTSFTIRPNTNYFWEDFIKAHCYRYDSSNGVYEKLKWSYGQSSVKVEVFPDSNFPNVKTVYITYTHFRTDYVPYVRVDENYNEGSLNLLTINNLTSTSNTQYIQNRWFKPSYIINGQTIYPRVGFMPTRKEGTDYLSTHMSLVVPPDLTRFFSDGNVGLMLNNKVLLRQPDAYV